MPKKNIDYSRTVIYKIVCNDLTVKHLFIGATTAFFKKKNLHKTLAEQKRKEPIGKGRRDCDSKLYQTIVNNGGWDNWCMIEVEKYPCKDFNEECARVRYWVETLNADLNGRTKTILTKEEQFFLISNHVCICGSKYKGQNMKDHENTDKHKKFIKKLQFVESLTKLHNETLEMHNKIMKLF